ncbi:LytR/AlgR family response regulator transcription factor [Ekhidna sp.]|uniref:LytR/AlgR family response regulator transcription factor n=1 Tax=Ekhidna sp. TaxID=2608089 RepID=UPI003CCB9923
MKILIVEDEIHISKLLEKQVAEVLLKHSPEITRIPLYDDAITYLEKNKIDVLMLDLNLGGKDGFELLKFLSAGAYHTIIVSAYKDRAIEAFEYGVLDFVPKPFSVERLRKAFSRIDDVEKKPEHPTKYYATRRRGRLHLVKDEEVAYFQAFGHYSKIHLKKGGEELHDKSLVQLLPLLSEDYERVHKSFIVKMSEIKDILVYEGGKYQIELKNGEIIPLGRARYKTIKEKWLQ